MPVRGISNGSPCVLGCVFGYGPRSAFRVRHRRNCGADLDTYINAFSTIAKRTHAGSPGATLD